ncbi:hypothetical protein [Saccharothrix australiensis]|uniref:Uncharacterized protein n=1 Tax=Saccharothrix australiensis TaxID=2072 RepID=A0A495W463_9PSEU|nr:hypothetical protein [Saccharothrix australiensis]RKT54588.1 hypothetical protein C8E97_3233 [Saccharothrix australiensis]
MTTTFAREIDRPLEHPGAAAGAPPDFATLTGEWVSVSPVAAGVSRVGLRARDGVLSVRATGRGEPRDGEWGERPVDRWYTDGLYSRRVMSFTTTFADERVVVDLLGYVSHGVLAAFAFHRFADGSGRDFLLRNFCAPAAPGEPAPATTRRLSEELPAGPNSADDLVGTWRCVDPHGRGIREISCAWADGGLVVGARGIEDWGRTRAALYVDPTELTFAPAFTTTFDHDFGRIHLYARVNLGLLVVVQLVEFTDGSGRADHFLRECYRR